jgi:hypothetical protein
MRLLFPIAVLVTSIIPVTAQQFRVGGLALDTPPKLSGNCATSTRVHFSGRINATGPGEVAYQWIRSDHATAPVLLLMFLKSGPLPVTYDWNVKGSAKGWAAFKILSPNSIQSNKAEFQINCRL